MDEILIALADPARWRLVNLLAERPRSVGVLAQLAGARQPQTSKHLQTLEQAGVLTSQRNGQRRIYALRSEPLRELSTVLAELANVADRVDGPRETFDRYGRSLEAERRSAHDAGWADGRTFTFARSLGAAPGRVWHHLTDEAALAGWWTPEGLRTSRLVFPARTGAQILQEYRDVDDVDDSDVVVGRAEGLIGLVVPDERLTYQLSPLLPDGGIAFTAHVDLRLTPTTLGTDLDVEYRISDSSVESADFIAGIEIGFGQSLDRLVATVAADSDTPRSINSHDEREKNNSWDD
ncbi:metalloregulator ArsR/SmtB family transcription factor [Agromyces sp. NPDC056965]|uniref:metalloregulator ArsR/SmtB family transcription factor n=1 Tax=Agromyces sp. NPDC056965 TaxID=3345983 RepID=UPI00362B200F